MSSNGSAEVKNTSKDTKESVDHNTKINKIREIIIKEFDEELKVKENEASESNVKIMQLLRNIDVLKYVATCSYYENNKQNTEQSSSQIQTRLHPAVKKSCSRLHYDVVKTENVNLNVADSNTQLTNNCSVKTEQTLLNNSEVKEEFKSENTENSITNKLSRPTVSNTNVKPNLTENSCEVFKYSQKLIVGNTSKWLPPDTREDNATHKWMVYVRDEEPDANLSAYISFVRFYLHESYSPNNIVDVTKPPYVISRRGWGEFTIKIRLFFVHTANKPVDVYHKIKLDQTMNGTTVLGSETVVSLSLFKRYEEECYNVATDEENDKDDNSEVEFCDRKKRMIDIEHDYAIFSISNR